MTTVRFLPDAQIELNREIGYLSERRPGTGIRFQAQVMQAVALITNHPLGGAPAAHGTRSMRVRGFPFSVIYRGTEDEVLVVAIAPHKRHPDYWKTRVRDG